MYFQAELVSLHDFVPDDFEKNTMMSLILETLRRQNVLLNKTKTKKNKTALRDLMRAL